MGYTLILYYSTAYSVGLVVTFVFKAIAHT